MSSPNQHVADSSSQTPSDMAPTNNKKRKLSANSAEHTGMDAIPSFLGQPELPEFNLTSASRPSEDSASLKLQNVESKMSQDWQTVEPRRKKAKKIPKQQSGNYPAIEFSKDSRLQSQIKISDLQNLILYILTDAPSPSFVSVRHRPEIRKVIVIMVPGLEKEMFAIKRKDGKGNEEHRNKNYNSPDEYYPVNLVEEELPESLKPFADMFKHLWPVKTPGDDKFSKMHSPLHAILTAPLPKTKEDKQWSKNKKGAKPVKEPHGWKNNRTPISEFVHSPEELLENEYVLHPASYSDEVEKNGLMDNRRSAGVSQEHGWVDSSVKTLDQGTPPDKEIETGSITAGREVLAMDCEMCMTGENEFSLTRISIVTWDGSVILDELVKPERPIINYLTQYSGITEQMIAPITTTLQDIQKKLLSILHPRAVLIGHSLNSDLNALKITHPFIIDTSIIFPHPRGPPLKSSLKWLAQRYLNREIQKGHGTTGPGAGHDSIEDARTCLDLVKQKCEKGKEWGMADAAGENLFKRIARMGVRYKNQGGSAIPSPLTGKSSAMIDWGEPKKGPGAASSFPIGCHSDEEVMKGVIRAVKGDVDGKEIPGGGVDFVWARFRELEALKGWWNKNKQTTPESTTNDTPTTDVSTEGIALTDRPKTSTAMADTPTDINPSEPPAASSLPPPPPDKSTPIDVAAAALTNRLHQIYQALPPCTALIIYSGSGDPREMSRLQAMQTQFKKEYKIRKWDELSVKWTDTEEQALKRAARAARDGLAFIGVK
ncbi:putative exonuclease [Lachnellula hyalina]|uniref:Putative exonuclease n=1 Tax=Lachnellula hyalina TaxID=1316788 RepID=A0A8H8QY20_9HELO|nr:putative exonuclease [Lachnellula hyalina]TVY24601.1 putative exonuclease [Lachnellula hyalina]